MPHCMICNMKIPNKTVFTTKLYIINVLFALCVSLWKDRVSNVQMLQNWFLHSAKFTWRKLDILIFYFFAFCYCVCKILNKNLKIKKNHGGKNLYGERKFL